MDQSKELWKKGPLGINGFMGRIRFQGMQICQACTRLTAKGVYSNLKEYNLLPLNWANSFRLE